MKVYAYDPYVNKRYNRFLSWRIAEKLSNLSDGLKEADIISLSVPLTEETIFLEFNEIEGSPR